MNGDVRTRRQSLRRAAMAGLAGLLMVGGCAQQSLTVSSSAGPSSKVAAGEPVKSAAEPLREESVKPMDVTKSGPPEVVKPLPLETAKAEPRERVQAGEPAAATRDVLDVYFAFDRWSLSPEARKNLERSIEAIKQTPSAPLLIEGHCDERGSREYNLVLGEKRAQEARRYLQALGVTNPVRVTSLGKERPVCTEQDESCYWKNRRAHLVVQDH